MPFIEGIYYADGATPMSIEVITAAMATSIAASISRFPTPVADASERDTKFPSPAQGDSVWRLDYSFEERYFDTYVLDSNEGGATPAGWYPVMGKMPVSVAGRTASQSISTAGTTLLFTQPLEISDYITYSSGFFTLAIPGRYEVVFQGAVTCSATQTDLAVELNSTVSTTTTSIGKIIKVLTANKTETVYAKWYVDVAIANTAFSVKGTATGANATLLANTAPQVQTYASIRYIGPTN